MALLWSCLSRVPLKFTNSSIRASSFLTSEARRSQGIFKSARMVQHVSSYRKNGDNGDDADTEGELNAWKHRAPYRVHDNDPDFNVRYEASCHCGKVKYQLSREKPLDAKYCHCHTCQKLHGMLFISPQKIPRSYGRQSTPKRFLVRNWTKTLNRSPFPMVCHLSQDRHQLHARPS